MGLPVCFEWIGYGASSNPAATVATKPWCRERLAAFLIGVKIRVCDIQDRREPDTSASRPWTELRKP
ncbi:hypothetical protein [Thermomonas sp.]|uniref:hypothetical protein n=1 Tax=Thermomonas sp. TaxID=1971895 RepID=UPI001D944B99|nr:hypothetical protein [Thermomonas sp.]MBZ0087193.1 hypothetical protein [Thermomonas sp.]HRO62553.1 hypothetical protein [Thermomonas sp.]